MIALTEKVILYLLCILLDIYLSSVKMALNLIRADQMLFSICIINIIQRSIMAMWLVFTMDHM